MYEFLHTYATNNWRLTLSQGLNSNMIWIALFFCMTFSIQLSNGSKNCFKNVTTKKLTKNEQIATKYSRGFSRGSGKDFFELYIFRKLSFFMWK